jgi:hypothetical protein
MKYFKTFIITLSVLSNAIAAEPVICRDMLITYDVAQLEAELTLVEGEYMPRHNINDNWLAIPLRNATGTDTQEGLSLSHSVKKAHMLACQNTQFLEKLPYMSFILNDIAQKFDAQVGLVRISKVPSQKKIKRHDDGVRFDIDEGAIYRLHIPIITGEDVFFEVDGRSYHLEPGRLYYTNVSKPHSVTNNGPIDRVHIVIDVQANGALHAHIMQSPEIAPIVQSDVPACEDSTASACGKSTVKR